jgi:hypothetical protein
VMVVLKITKTKKLVCFVWSTRQFEKLSHNFKGWFVRRLGRQGGSMGKTFEKGDQSIGSTFTTKDLTSLKI